MADQGKSNIDKIKELIEEKKWWRKPTRDDWSSFDVPELKDILPEVTDEERQEIEIALNAQDGKDVHAKIARTAWTKTWDMHFFGRDEEKKTKKTKNYNTSSGGISKDLDDFMVKNKLVWIPYNEFVVGGSIGAGGFGEVFKATLEVDRVEVALKRLKVDDMNGFFKEWGTHAKFLYSREIVNVIGFTKNPDNTDYLAVMAYANRGTLKKNLEKIYKSGWKQKLYILYKIASGLREIHQHGYAHLDLHDENILINKVDDDDGDEFTIDEGDDVWICDLGLCHTVESSHMSGIYGRMVFTAPEAFKGKRFKSNDIYSFSMIMYELAFGAEPFSDRNMSTENILQQDIMTGKRPKIAKYIPPDYQSLMEKCWDNDPKKRPTAEQVLFHIMELIFKSEEDNPDIIMKIKEFIDADGKRDHDIPPSSNSSKSGIIALPPELLKDYGNLEDEYNSKENEYNSKENEYNSKENKYNSKEGELDIDI